MKKRGVYQSVAFLVVLGCSTQTDPEAEKAAVQSALDWLKVVDAGEYGTSWENAAEFFKNAVAKDAWEQQLKAGRAPLGKVKSRELGLCQYRTSVPGAPDGKYVIVQFKTSFDNKEAAVETITPLLDKDGKWKVSGYFIK